MAAGSRASNVSSAVVSFCVKLKTLEILYLQILYSAKEIPFPKSLPSHS